MNFFKLIKGIYKKPIGDIIFNDQKLSAWPLLKEKARMSAFTSPVQRYTESLSII